MTSGYEDTVLDFDLDFLVQPTATTNNTFQEHAPALLEDQDLQAKVDELQLKNGRLRKSILFLKPRVRQLSHYVCAYKAASKELEQFKDNLRQAKENCTRHLMEINNFTDRVARLEDEKQAAEIREKEKNETICEMENKILALQMVHTQLKLLVKDKNKTESHVNGERKKGQAGVTDNAKKGLSEKEVETLRRDNAKILNLQKENEKLRKDNSRIPNLEKQIEILNKKNTSVSKSEKVNDQNEMGRIQKLEKEIETLRKENVKILNLEKEIEDLNKENIKIPKLVKEIEILRKENAKILILKKEIEDLNKENARIPKFVKEIEMLRKENAKITQFQNVNEKNDSIANLENEIKKHRTKKANIDIVNKAFSKEIGKTPTKVQNIDTCLTHLNLTKAKGELPPKKSNLTRKYKSLFDRNSECSDISEVENNVFEDPMLSPTPNDTILAKQSPIADKYVVVLCESDNENSNEVVSIDTGRGSSFTNSDTDKGVHSPEYFFNDSPLNEDNIENNAESEDATMPSSPIMIEEIETPTITIVKHNENQNVCKPKRVSHRKSNSKLLSPISQTNAVSKVSNGVDTSDNLSTNELTQGVQEKESLEINNSLHCESHTDKELEQIFRTMKLNYNVLSPIPRTPTWGLEDDSRSGPNDLNEKIDTCIMCAKSGEFMRIITALFLQYAHLQNSDTNNGMDKLIEYLDSVLKSKQILPKNSLPNTISYLEKSHDYNNLRSILNSESAASSQQKDKKTPQKDKQILQIERDESRLSQNIMSFSMLQSANENQLLRNDNNTVSISDLSSTDKNTNVLRDKQIEKGLVHCIPTSVDENSEQLFNHSIPEELPADNEISKAVRVGKKSKTKKITKLESLKKKLKPKYKIGRAKTPPVKLRIKPKQIFPILKKVTVNDTSASLNDKDVYEKAVKIMAEINSQQTVKLAKSSKQDEEVMPPRRTASLEKDTPSGGNNQELQSCPTLTGGKRFSELLNPCTVVLLKDPLLVSPRKIENCTTDQANEDNNSKTHAGEEDNNFTTNNAKENNGSSDELPPKKKRRRSSNEPLIQYKRVLRSDTVHKRLSIEDNIEQSSSKGESDRKSTKSPSSANESDVQLSIPNNENTLLCQQLDQHKKSVTYGDLDIFSEDLQHERNMSAPLKEVNTACHPKESILCCMIEKYGVETVRPFEKKIPDKIAKQVCEKIEQEIAKIKLTNDSKNGMNSFVADLRKLNYKHFVAGLMQYLVKPERKNELFGKVSSSPAPPMTKAEQILLYVIAHLKSHWPSVDIVDAVLSNIEYALFKLNRTPEFDVIESASHFYAVLCRYFKAKSRLRLFILDAMYCIQFKSVPLIKQCLEVWMHIIPLAHMGIAKSPMVTCLVYLLHFYKCDDRHNRVQDIRNILSRKYFYQITDWNEPKILEMFKDSIRDLKDISIEKKMLRLALIILAKRHGPQWCQTNIIKNLLQPMIDKENVPYNVKEFCVSVIGPLMKPYPADMKVHCEIAINQLMNILNNNPSPKMEEAAITSMMYINRHDQRSVNKMLLSRKMKPMSLELEKSIRDYVKAKSLTAWKKNLAKMVR